MAKGEVRVRKQFLCGLADRDGVLWMSGDGPAAADLVIVDVRPDKSYLLGWVDRQHFVVFEQYAGSGSCLAGECTVLWAEDIAGFFFRVGIFMWMLKETELIFQLQDAQDTLVDQ